MRLYYQENSKIFNRILEESLMMDTESSRSLLGLLMINKPIGETCIDARRKLPIKISKADLEFTNTLVVYDRLMKLAMKDIINTMLKSRNICDFYIHLSPLGRTVVYSQVKAARAYYRATLQTLDMIPDVCTDILRDGFLDLYVLRTSIENTFRPNKEVRSRLRHTMPPKSAFVGKDRMLWYLCYTDLVWSKEMFKGIKSSAVDLKLLPLNWTVQLIEILTQGYFTAYMSGISKLTLGLPLTSEEYIILRMCFENDVINYQEIAWYYSKCNILPNEFFDELEVLNSNMAYMLDRLVTNSRRTQ